MELKRIGITRLTAEWKRLLDQTGIFYEEVRHNSSHYQLIIVTDKSYLKEWEEFLYRGGIIIDAEGAFFRRSTGLKIRRRFITSCPVPQQYYTPLTASQLDLFTHCRLVQKELIHTEKVGEGLCIHWGIPVQLLSDHKSIRKTFQLPGAHREPAEELSLVSKGNIPLLFFQVIKSASISQKVPFLHKSFFRETNPPLLFRIDSDEGTKERVHNWHDIAKKRSIKTTWFIHTDAHDSWLQEFHSFNNDEFGLHCSSHIDTPEYEDIDRALEILNAKEFNPKGYAAPYGISRPHIDQYLHSLGFSYGSDFSFLYDSLPLVDDKRLLQIPIHPICINSFLSYKISDKMIREYYTNYIDMQIAAGLPVTLYDHLLHEKQELMGEILSYAIAKGAKPTTFLEYANFWKSRLSDNNLPYFKDTLLHKTGSTPLVYWHDEKHFSFIINEKSDVTQLQIRKLPKIELPSPQPILSRFSFRQLKNSFINRFLWRNKR